MVLVNRRSFLPVLVAFEVGSDVAANAGGIGGCDKSSPRWSVRCGPERPLDKTPTDLTHARPHTAEPVVITQVYRRALVGILHEGLPTIRLNLVGVAVTAILANLASD